jgi:uncharacterized integral membrane protein
MRAIQGMLLGALGLGVLVVLAAIAAQNVQMGPVHLFGGTVELALWGVIVGSAALGLALGLLLMAPGQLMLARRLRALQREMTQLRAQKHSLEERQAALQAERDTIQAERDHLRMRVAQMARAGASTNPEQAAAGRPSSDGRASGM